MAIGLDPLHFGLIVIFNLLIGGLTPPFGALLYVMVHIARVRFGALVVALGPFYLFLLAMLMLIATSTSISEAPAWRLRRLVEVII